ncbi:MAG TPA: hypothetical protein VKB46_21970, partial [Pyrinomonadaceae bacterium]|nr:hypothetical protein [Pyrinomonadaceae bacterium]
FGNRDEPDANITSCLIVVSLSDQSGTTLMTLRVTNRVLNVVRIQLLFKDPERGLSAREHTTQRLCADHWDTRAFWLRQTDLQLLGTDTLRGL